MRCQSCEQVRVCGVVCHEAGCPDAHIGTVRECKWCGTEYEPEERGQRFCSVDCGRSWLGLDTLPDGEDVDVE